MANDNILIWLPSPLGDAIMCTPALGAIRERFPYADITFLCSHTVQQILSPNSYSNRWLIPKSSNPFELATEIRKHRFTHVILFKNSFGSAFAVFLARIKERIGYVRQGRGIFLNSKLYPDKLESGEFKPMPMVDYYLAVASWMGADVDDRKTQLEVSQADIEDIGKMFPQLTNSESPVVILVPGGAFGPSKFWLSERFAETADKLIEKYNAQVVISVAPNEAEKKIADEIQQVSKNKFINIGEYNLSLSHLKALYSKASLIITNDTGPRHIAIALGKSTITMFGPNDPAWTESGADNEIQIVGKGDCVPCRKKVCERDRHICMESITVEDVMSAAERLLCK